MKRGNETINVNNGFLERTFKLTESNTTVKTEITEGITSIMLGILFLLETLFSPIFKRGEVKWIN